MVATYSTLFDVELRKRLAERAQVLAEEVISPTGCSDLHTYKFKLGQLQAFREVVEMCEDVTKTINER